MGKKFADTAIAIDTETTGLNLHNNDRMFVISTCDEEGRTGYWEWPVDPKTRIPKVPRKQIGEVAGEINQYGTLVFHHSKFDMRALSLANLNLGHRWKHIHDTMLMSHVLDSFESHGLKDLAIRYLQMGNDDEKDLIDQVKRARRKATSIYPHCKLGESVKADYWLPAAIFPNEENKVEKYAVLDAVRTIELYKLFTYALETEGLTHIYERERKLLPIIYRMESRGVSVKVDKFAEKYKKQEIGQTQSLEKLRRIVKNDSFNPKSPQQLVDVLHKKFRLPVIKTTKGGGPSTDADTLERHKESTVSRNTKKFIDALLDYKSGKTTLGYLKNYSDLWVNAPESRKHKLLHPNFNQTGTRTTRFSSSNPNGQNVGKQSKVNLREIFGPLPEDNWYCFDYDQLELRIAAVAAKDKNLQGAFNSGTDVHQYTADICNSKLEEGAEPITRSHAKTVNYAITYGAGAERLEALTGVKGIKDTYFQAYPGLLKLMRKLGREGKKKGFITTRMGYPLKVSKEKEYAALNYHIQGWAGDILKNTMIELNARMPKLRIIMTIHDELVFAIAKNTRKHILTQMLNKIRDIMVGNGELLDVHTPISCSVVTDNWADKKEIEL